MYSRNQQILVEERKRAWNDRLGQEGEEERANETPYEIQMQWGSESARRWC
ncbi:hypothetical protein ALC53_03966 [Atta colombica]|uniref:Uncharacterized protein n=1 Tax=Atta colombica TaxID=520822 RepID=A0A195BMJ4_9HYME|nr:hypothetical protein ALC53_03966 [Atta colombica]